MKSSMLKLLILILISSFAVANSNISDKELIEFLKKGSNPQIQIKDIEIVSKKEIKEAPNWYAYFLLYEFVVKDLNKTMKQPNIVYSNGVLVANSILNMKTNSRLSNTVAPDFDEKLYDKEHLLYGEESAKHKFVIFSDPQCPFCLDQVPFMLELAKKHPKEIALYYYHFPLSIHPAATTIVKATLVAEKEGLEDAVLKVYEAYIDTKSSNENEVLKIFNKKLKTSITKEQINQKDIIEKLNKDLEISKRMFVRGTPTLFVDGILDFDRSKYIEIEKQLNKK